MLDMEAFITENVDRTLEAVTGAEVLVMGFWMFSERLLVDFRSSEMDPPLIRVVPQVGSAQERLRELRVLRPRFTAPRRFYFFIWSRSLAMLEARGVWPQVVERCLTAGHEGTAAACAEARNVLQRMEALHLEAAVKGQGYRTMWERSRR